MQLIYKAAEEVIVFMGDGRSHRVSKSQLLEPPVYPMITLHGHERDEVFLAEMLSTCRSSGPRKLALLGTATACAMSLISLFSDQDRVQERCLELMRLNERTRYHMFENLRDFVVCSWWSRIWVVQEIAVGTAVTIQWGTFTLSWEILVATANVWSLPKTRQVASNSGIEPENLKVFVLFANQLTGLEETRRRWRAEGGTDLVRLLQEFSDRQASDDRDKVYGLLSLSKQDQRYVKPNYELDVFETYRATALALIGKGESLACWAGDQKRKFNKGLPSWIPDWSTAVDNGDKRRMDLFDSYSANCGWALRIIESEAEYWNAVEDEMELLINSPAGKAGKLPSSLNPFVLAYIDLLTLRARLFHHYRVDADELDQSGMERLSWDRMDWLQGHTLDSTLKSLKWCISHDVTPRSGVSLLERWIRDVEKLQNEIRLEQAGEKGEDWSKEEQIRQHLRSLRSASESEALNMKFRVRNARDIIYDIESTILVSKDDTPYVEKFLLQT